jgi:hypothetical protein
VHAGVDRWIDEEDVARRLAGVRARISAVGDPHRVKIVAVTKGFGVEAVRAAAAAGLQECGENYARELLAKAQVSPPGVRWHFLGAPQRNKMAALAPVVALWQAADRLAVVERLARVAPGAPLLVQVDVVGAPGKAGCPPDEVAGLVERSRQLGLDVRGLMVVGPAGDPHGTQAAFATVAALGRSLGLAELSMGMTDDFEAAVAAGSTMVRLGRILFGPRPGRIAARR